MNQIYFACLYIRRNPEQVISTRFKKLKQTDQKIIVCYAFNKTDKKVHICLSVFL